MKSRTELKPQLTIATVSGTGPKARFFSALGSITGTDGTEVPDGQRKTVYTSALDISKSAGKQSQPLYFAVTDLFAKGGPKSSVPDVTMDKKFDVNYGKVQYGGSPDGFYVCPGTKAIGGGDKTYDAIVLGMGSNPSGCEKVTLKLDNLRH